MSDFQDWREPQLRHAIKAARVALWSWNVDNNAIKMDDRAFEIWGLERSENVCFEDLSANVHPADRDRVRAAFEATRAVLGPFEIDFRVIIGDFIRWVSARGEGSDFGIVGRVMFGVFLDVTGRKQAEEGNELLAGEMSHRVKNLLAIAMALTTITSRSTLTSAEMARDLIHRLTALGRAHDLVRPLQSSQGHAALLGDILSVLLSLYDDQGAFKGRVRVSVSRMGVGEKAATVLAMIVHELATNSLKYGALSVPTGVLDVSSNSQDEEIVITWTEQGGPPAIAPSGDLGYGAKLMERTLASQLGGSMERDWTESGLLTRLRLRANALAT